MCGRWGVARGSLCVLTRPPTPKVLSASFIQPSFENWCFGYPSPLSSAHYWARWTLPPPNFTLTVGRSWEPLQSVVVASTSHRWLTSSFISSRSKTQGRSCGSTSMVWQGGFSWHSSNNRTRGLKRTSSKFAAIGGTPDGFPLYWTEKPNLQSVRKYGFKLEGGGVNGLKRVFENF